MKAAAHKPNRKAADKARPRMARELAEACAVGDPAKPKFDCVALVRGFKKYAKVTVYADTSWWLAYKSRRDANHNAVIALFDSHPQAKVIWTPWHRVGVFNAFRQLERTGAVDSGDARQQIRIIEQEVRLGDWPHAEFEWRNAVRTACELSAEHGLSVPIRGMDLFHVAIAIETGAGAILSFDGEQKDLAEAAGVRILSLAVRRWW